MWQINWQVSVLEIKSTMMPFVSYDDIWLRKLLLAYKQLLSQETSSRHGLSILQKDVGNASTSKNAESWKSLKSVYFVQWEWIRLFSEECQIYLNQHNTRDIAIHALVWGFWLANKMHLTYLSWQSLMLTLVRMLTLAKPLKVLGAELSTHGQ